MATQLATTEETNAALPALTVEGERFALRQRQARMFAMSPLVPDHLRKGSAEQAIANCWIALTLAEAMGEVPLIVMQNIHVVNGKAGFASQYMIARANSSGIFKGRIDWRIEGKGADLSVTAYAILKDTGQEVAVTCDMAMATAEGWTKNPKYKTMPEVMLRYRSAAFLVRFYAPDVMLGYQSTEEVEDMVAATVPSQPPLTATMLVDQSQAAPAEETPHDPDTGEIIDADANQADDSRPAQDKQPKAGETAPAGEPQPETPTDTAADELSPAQVKANEIVGEITAAISIMDVNSIESRSKPDMAAMGDELADYVQRVIDTRKREIKAAHEKAKAAEKAPAE